MRRRTSSGSVVTSLSLAFFFVCFLLRTTPCRAATNVYCWGQNTYNALGTGSTTDVSTPSQGSQLAALGSFTAVSAGQYHTCGILSNGTLKCWGSAENGALGPNATPTTTPNAPVTASSRTITSVSCGSLFTCAVDASANLACWGENSQGQLGNGSTSAYSSTERNVTSLSQVQYISASYGYACAVVSNGTGYCWGWNTHGQLGTGNMNNASLPATVAIPGNVALSMIATGIDHACGLTTTYELYCWGNNANGAVGVGSNDTSIPTPTKVNGTYLTVAAGQEFTCATSLASRNVYCWGYAQNGILGDGANSGSQNVPLLVSSLNSSSYVALAAGYTAAFGVRVDGNTLSWGRQNNNQLGRNGLTSGAIYTPAAVSPAAVFGGGVTINPFGSFACALAGAIGSPTPSPTPSRTPSPSQSPSSSPSPSPSPSSTPSASLSPSPSPSVSPSAAPVPSVLVQPQFNSTVPTVAIAASESAAQRINLNLVSLEEISATDTTLQYIDLQEVGWQMEGNGSTAGSNVTRYAFTSQLGSVTGGANNATLQYSFYSYSSDQVVALLGGNYTFTALPPYLKFSLNISSWAWNSSSGKLRLTMKIAPSFTRYETWPGSPQAGMTTYLFASASADQASTVMRLLNFGEELGAGGVVSSSVPLDAEVDVPSSSLALTFDHFASTNLLFDPDVGLLLGSKAGSGGGDDNLGLIIGVAVAVPLAVLFVVGAIAVISLVVYLRRRAEEASSGVVSFDAIDEEGL